MTFTRNKLALSVAAAAFSMAVVAPVQAADTKAERVADATARKAEALELQMQQMADQMQAMQAELNRVKNAAKEESAANAKVQELDQWMASMKSAPEASSPKDNLVAVRGGWEVLDHARSAGDPTKEGAFLSNNKNAQGFMFGGAFDFNVNNDLFGVMDDTSFMVELGFEYAQFGQGQNALTSLGVLNTPIATPGATNIATGITTTSHTSTDARLRLNASPKIKFMHGSRFRPWLIPVGMELNILGVPSNAVSVLNSGMQFGAGAEYDLFRGIVLGTDARYHYSTGKINGTPTDGFSLGGYVGFKF